MKLDYNVNSIPDKKQCGRSNRKNIAILMAFCASGKPTAIVKDGTRKAASIRQCLDVTIKRENFPCFCTVRDGTLYLVRKDAENV